MASPTPLSRTARERPARPPNRWIWRDENPAAAARLASEGQLPALVARILAARGISEPEAAHAFLSPALAALHDPAGLRGMGDALVRIGQAMDAGEKICVFGDYDVDGATATTIMVLTFDALNYPVEYYIPHRLHEGYGVSADALNAIAADGVRLVITVDCGITAVEQVLYAKQLGLELIITDHHEPGTGLPAAVAVINPKRHDCDYPFKGLSGAGVAFKLAHALLRARHADAAVAREFLKTLLDLVALGTVADIMPLTGENRSLVAHGLERLRREPRTGIASLLRQAQMDAARVDTGEISFIIAPRLNAAGRTEHAMFSVELLRTTNVDEGQSLAKRLEEFNLNRREIEQVTFDEALELLEYDDSDPVIVVAQDGWHHGVLGIVASRILALYHRPVIVIGIDGGVGKGSARSIHGFDLHHALGECAEHLKQFGGHKMAAGLSIQATRIEEFRLAINNHARQTLDTEHLRPRLEIDVRALPIEITRQAVEQLMGLAPFGAENPKPIVSLEGYQVLEPPRVLKERHLKMNLVGPDGESLSAIGWGMAHRLAEIPMHGAALHIAGVPFLNTWNGRTNVELELKDFQIVAAI